MKPYKKWTGAQRLKSLKLTNQAFKLGLLERPTKCSKCGQTEGILHTHNENYDATLEYVPKLIAGTITPEERKAVDEALIDMCWRCHMIFHSEHRNPEAFKRYWEEVAAGKQYRPVYGHNFLILKENGF